jgi:uridylate kinase
MRIVLRIGGSVVASPVNPALINDYTDLLKKLKEQGHEVAVVVGGGALARDFIRTAKKIGLKEEAQDEVAISVSRVFAQLFLKKIGRLGCKNVPVTIGEAARCLHEGKIVVMGGLKPGMTTDTVAALLAEKMDADLLIKGTDQEGVYDKDPKKHPDAVKLKRLSYADLSKVFVEDKHKAGIHQVLDPEAVKVMRRKRIQAVIVNGFKPENMMAAVEGKAVGTVIS